MDLEGEWMEWNCMERMKGFTMAGLDIALLLVRKGNPPGRNTRRGARR